MEQVAPSGDVYQAGTLSGNPLAVAAGRATLELLDPAAYDRLSELTGLLVTGLRAAIDQAGAGAWASVASAPGLVTLFISASPPHDFAAAKACDLDAYGALCRGLLERGVYAPPSQFEAWFVSLAHDRTAIERSCAAVAETLAEIRR